MKLERKFVGTRYYDERPVTATDPCYKAGTWCTLFNINVKPGNYECVAWKARLSYTGSDKKRHYYKRVFVCGIYLGGDLIPEEKFEEIGTIGVDSGLAGFFQDKPDYGDTQWEKFCDNCDGKDYMIVDEGFFTETGYGDGGYPVFAAKNENGEIVALEIRF